MKKDARRAKASPEADPDRSQEHVPAKHSTDPRTNDQPSHEEQEEFVEETSRDSLPASDPPAW